MSRVLHSSTAGLDQPDDEATRFRWRDVSAWGFSMAAHAVVLLLLSLVYFDVEQKITTLIDSAFEDVDAAEYKFDSTVVDQIGSEASVETMSSSQAAAVAVATGRNTQADLESKVDETLNVGFAVTDSIVQPARTEILGTVQTNGGSEHAAGVESPTASKTSTTSSTSSTSARIRR